MKSLKGNAKSYLIIAVVVFAGWLLFLGGRTIYVHLTAPSKISFDAKRILKSDAVRTAEQESAEAADKSIEVIHEFFDVAKQNSPRFAERVLGWRSKWALMVDCVPFTDKTRHEKFMNKCFSEEFFTTESLQKTIESAVEFYFQEVESIENTMLVNINQDVPDLPENSPFRTLTPDELKRVFAVTLQTSAVQGAKAASASIKSDVAMLVISEVICQIALRLGTSAGILTIGASTSWASMGITMALAVIVDQAVAWIWDWYADPEGDIATKMNAELDRIEKMIIEGDGETKGLRETLAELDRQRNELRKETLKTMAQ